jgi:hypothetical protein
LASIFEECYRITCGAFHGRGQEISTLPGCGCCGARVGNDLRAWQKAIGFSVTAGHSKVRPKKSDKAPPLMALCIFCYNSF